MPRSGSTWQNALSRSGWGAYGEWGTEARAGGYQGRHASPGTRGRGLPVRELAVCCVSLSAGGCLSVFPPGMHDDGPYDCGAGG